MMSPGSSSSYPKREAEGKPTMSRATPPFTNAETLNSSSVLRMILNRSPSPPNIRYTTPLSLPSKAIYHRRNTLSLQSHELNPPGARHVSPISSLPTPPTDSSSPTYSSAITHTVAQHLEPRPKCGTAASACALQKSRIHMEKGCHMGPVPRHALRILALAQSAHRRYNRGA